MLELFSTLLSHDVLSVAAELKIDLLPASSENRPISFSAVLSFKKASMLIDFFGVSLQMGSFRVTIVPLSQVIGPSPSFFGFSAKKSKAYFVAYSEIYLLIPRFSIASKSFSSVLKDVSTIVIDVYWELLAMSIDLFAFLFVI